MSTSFPMSIPHAPTGFVNQAALDTAWSVPINDLYALLAPGIIPLQRIQATQTTAGQSLGNGVFTTITGYAAADVDTLGGLVLATGIWTCPTTGTYELNGQVSATGATAVRLIAGIQKNGGSVIHSAYASAAPTVQATAVITPKEFALNAGDTLVLQGNPNAAGIVTTTQNGNSTFLRIKRIS